MKYFILNHKMNLTYSEILSYREQIQKIDVSHVYFVVVPSYPYFFAFQNSSFKLGSQNVSFQKNGALTGEVSANQLSSMGVSYTIVAHSERRNIMKEKSPDFIAKISLLLEENITPIFCIGETEEERDKGFTNDVLKKQINDVFSKFSTEELQRIIIAYEPIWAIGTGKIPQNEEIFNSIDAIKKFVFSEYQIHLPVLYGGSVSPTNIASLEKVSNIDGYLIGGAGLDPQKVAAMLKEVM